MQTEPNHNLPGHASQNQPRTQLSDLRDLLSEIENGISRIADLTAPEALALLPMMDQADAKLQQLSAAGSLQSSEASQFETLVRQFHTRGNRYLRQVGGPAALQQARRDHPDRSNKDWWVIDQILTAERQAKTRRVVRNLSIAAALLLILTVVYQRWLAPDPDVQAGVGFEQSAENMLIQGDQEDALEAVDAAIIRLPDSPQLLVLRGVIHETMDEFELAEKDYEQAQEAIELPESFHTQRARYYMLANLPEQAIADAETALAINPEMAAAHMYMGQAYELLGDYQAAMDSYETASAVAGAVGNPQLDVMARMQLANLLQALPMLEAQEQPAGE